jgi:hypothetical protein
MGRLLRGGLYQQTTRLWCTTAFLITETLEEFCPALDPFAVLTVSSLARWLAGWPRSACCVRRHRGHGALLSVFRPGLPIAAACFCPRGEASSCCDRPCLVFVGTGGARGGGRRGWSAACCACWGACCGSGGIRTPDELSKLRTGTTRSRGTTEASARRIHTCAVVNNIIKTHPSVRG